MPLHRNRAVKCKIKSLFAASVLFCSLTAVALNVIGSTKDCWHKVVLVKAGSNGL